MTLKPLPSRPQSKPTEDTFKKFFGGTMGIVVALLILAAGLCLCCLILAAYGQTIEGTPTPAALAPRAGVITLQRINQWTKK